MRVKRKLLSVAGLVLLVVLLVGLLAPLAVAADTSGPVLPTAFFGTVTINGAPAPLGTMIKGTIASAAGTPGYGSITTTIAGQYGVAGLGPKLTVQTDNQTDIGKAIVFSAQIPGYTITSIHTASTAVYDSDVHELNITLTGDIVSTGGGGGGGGGPSGPTSVAGVTDVSSIVNGQGVFSQEVYIWSDDLKVLLDVKAGTTGLTSDGKPLSKISLIHQTTPPPINLGANIIGLSYDFTPAGATFNPAIIIRFSYDPALVRAGVSPSSLQIAYFDSIHNYWVTLTTTSVDTTNHYIFAQLSHFTPYAVTSGLPATPVPVITSSTTTTTTVVTTTPTTTTTTPTTTTTTTTPTTTKTSTTTTMPTTTTMTTSTTTTTTPPPTKATNWGIIIGIIGGLVVIVIIVAVVLTRRKK